MLRLGICGDDISRLESIKKVLLDYPGTEKVELFSGREEMLRSILQSDAAVHVILLDIRPGGVVQGQQLRCAEDMYDLAPNVEVLLLSFQLSGNAFQRILLRRIHLLGIVDPQDSKLLFSYLDKVLCRQREEGYLCFSFRGKQYSLEFHRLLYLESHNHVIIAHTAQKTFSFYRKLGELVLPDYFVQCHKSYIVNTRQILTKESKCVIVANGDIIPVSRAYRENLEAKLRHDKEKEC